jgi:DNA-binding protein HU-beta
MNKTEFVAAVAEKSGLSKVDSQKAIEAFQDVVAEVLQKGDQLALLGWGTFSVKENAERQGINPRTKEKITIAAKKVVKFKAGAKLEDVIK